MKIGPQIQQKKSNISFDGYGKISKVAKYKLTDSFANALIYRTIENNEDIAFATAETLEREYSELKSLYGNSLLNVSEFFNMAKNGKKDADLTNIVKKLFKQCGLTDDKGIFTKLPLKSITITEGNDVIPDEILADEIIDYGSKGVKLLKGKMVSVIKNNDVNLAVEAEEGAIVRHSSIKSVKSDDYAIVKYSNIAKGINAKKEFIGVNVVANNLTVRNASIEGSKNIIKRIIASGGFHSKDSLTSDFVESSNGYVSILGENNKVKIIKAKEHVYVDNNVGEKVETQDGGILGLNNKIQKFLAGGFISITNTVAKSVKSISNSVSIEGEKNIIDFIVARRHAVAVNLKAKTIESIDENVVLGNPIFANENNEVTGYIKAKKIAQLRNTTVRDITCSTFVPIDNVVITGKIDILKPKYRPISYEQIVDKAFEDGAWYDSEIALKN